MSSWNTRQTDYRQLQDVVRVNYDSNEDQEYYLPHEPWNEQKETCACCCKTCRPCCRTRTRCVASTCFFFTLITAIICRPGIMPPAHRLIGTIVYFVVIPWVMRRCIAGGTVRCNGLRLLEPVNSTVALQTDCELEHASTNGT